MHGTHLVSHIRNPELRSDNTLHVIGVISNSVRYQSRYRLFREWYDRMLKTPNVQVYVVETAFGDRHHEVTDSLNPNHLQLRTNRELWHKENMINLGARHLLPRDWKYMAWVDCDIEFRNPNWALKTIHELQHFEVVQPWTTCADLGPYGEQMEFHQSFGHGVKSNSQMQSIHTDPYKYFHCGYAWACTRKFYEAIEGKLIDFAILGSADYHMAWAMLGKVDKSLTGMHEGFIERAHEWEKKAFRATKGLLGAVEGHIEHAFHGAKKNRFYRTRNSIITNHNFDPRADLAYDDQGLLYVIDKPGLVADIAGYMRSRNEDSIEPR